MVVQVSKQRTERLVEWVTGGRYAVAVEIDAVFLPGRSEPFLSPETVRRLEQICKDAQAGDVAALQKAGKVFVHLEETAAK